MAVVRKIKNIKMFRKIKYEVLFNRVKFIKYIYFKISNICQLVLFPHIGRYYKIDLYNKKLTAFENINEIRFKYSKTKKNNSL